MLSLIIHISHFYQNFTPIFPHWVTTQKFIPFNAWLNSNYLELRLIAFKIILIKPITLNHQHYISGMGHAIIPKLQQCSPGHKKIFATSV